jgi:hypothetical protein
MDGIQRRPVPPTRCPEENGTRCGPARTPLASAVQGSTHLNNLLEQLVVLAFRVQRAVERHWREGEQSHQLPILPPGNRCWPKINARSKSTNGLDCIGADVLTHGDHRKGSHPCCVRILNMEERVHLEVYMHMHVVPARVLG